MSDYVAPRVTLRTPTDVLAAVPYLLGFHPGESVVIIGLHGARLAFNVRADLPPAARPPHAGPADAGVPPDQPPAAAAPDRPADPAGQLAEQLADVVAEHAVTR